MAGNNVTFDIEETGSEAPQQQQQDQPQEGQERPDWLPENFNTVEDFVASYQETKGTLTKTQQELAALKEGAGQENEEGEEGEGAFETDKIDDAAQKVSEAADFDLTPYQEEYNNTGTVSEESREALAEGLKKVLGDDARSVVDQFIDTKAVAHQNDLRVYMETAGGEENYQNMMTWASQNLSPDQIAAYNKQVNSGDRSSVIFAIDALKARYEAANGRAPSLIRGRAPASTSGVRPFASTAELTRAMSDEKYKTDPSYREEVQQRLAVSQFMED